MWLVLAHEGQLGPDEVAIGGLLLIAIVALVALVARPDAARRDPRSPTSGGVED